jgi:hypothetical protein
MALIECNQKFHFFLVNKIMWLILIKCGGKKKGTMSMCRSRNRMDGKRQEYEGREENLVYLAHINISVLD